MAKHSRSSDLSGGKSVSSRYSIHALRIEDATLNGSYADSTDNNDQSADARYTKTGTGALTPFVAYETAVHGCIQATREFIIARQAIQSVSKLATSGAKATVHANTWHKRVEVYEKTMTKAYRLLAADATQTHTTSPRIGTIFTDTTPPSYEQATGMARNNSIEFSPSVLALKDQERDWRCWWRSLTGTRLNMTTRQRRELQDKHTQMYCWAGKTANVIQDMKKVEDYLLDVENGARKYLQDIDQAVRTGNGVRRKSINVRQTSAKEKNPQVISQKSGRSQQQPSMKVIPMDHRHSRSGVAGWILRSFSPAMRDKRGQGRHKAAAVPTGPSVGQRIRSTTTIVTQSCQDSNVPFKTYKVEALYGCEPEFERCFKKGNLVFTAGIIIDVVGISDRSWLLGEYTDRSGKLLTGRFCRNYTAPYHPEIYAQLARSAHKPQQVTESRRKRWSIDIGVHEAGKVCPSIEAISASDATSSPEMASNQHSISERLHSLDKWLDRERQHYGLVEEAVFRNITVKVRPPLHNIPALVERLDALNVLLEAYQLQGLEINGMIARMRSLRAKAKRRVEQHRSCRYYDACFT